MELLIFGIITGKTYNLLRKNRMTLLGGIIIGFILLIIICAIFGDTPDHTEHDKDLW
jgi:hypothetical protein